MIELPTSWRQTSLRDACVLLTDGTHYSPKSDSGPFKYITSRNVRMGFVDLSECAYISEVEHDEIYRGCPVKHGDVLLTKDGANTGNVALNPLEEPFSLLSSVAVLRADANMATNPYLYQFIASPRGQYLLKSQIAGQAITRLTLRKIGSTKIPLPPLAEQRKIAEILGAWDEAIALTERLIAAKQQRKKGLMQRLLTGQVRFPEFRGTGEMVETKIGRFPADWNAYPLEKILIPTPRKVTKPNGPYTALSVRSHGKGTFQRDVEDPASVAMSHLFQVQGGDLIVNITFAWEGAIAIVPSESSGCLVSHRFPTYRLITRLVDTDFFRHLMITGRFFYQLGLISPGGAGRNRVMSKRAFLKLEVMLPSLAEQNRIGEALAQCSEELILLERKVAALRQQKKGLMQRLLTGQVRVKV